jgi:hypothetical protein
MKLPKSWADVTVPQLIELEAINNDESGRVSPLPWRFRERAFHSRYGNGGNLL